MRVFPTASRQQLVRNSGTNNRPAGINAGAVRNGGIVQILPQCALPHTYTAQGQLRAVFYGGAYRVDTLSQWIQCAGQWACIMDSTGVSLKEAAMTGLRVRRQAQCRQTALRSNIFLAESMRHNAWGQVQPPCDAIQIITRKDQIVPMTTAIAASGTDKRK